MSGGTNTQERPEEIPLLESAVCYAKKEPVECLAALLGVVGGLFYSVSDPFIRICSAATWCAGNLLWVAYAHEERKWGLFWLQVLYFVQNVFAIGNIGCGWW